MSAPTFTVTRKMAPIVVTAEELRAAQAAPLRLTARLLEIYEVCRRDRGTWFGEGRP